MWTELASFWANAECFQSKKCSLETISLSRNPCLSRLTPNPCGTCRKRLARFGRLWESSWESSWSSIAAADNIGFTGSLRSSLGKTSPWLVYLKTWSDCHRQPGRRVLSRCWLKFNTNLSYCILSYGFLVPVVLLILTLPNLHNSNDLRHFSATAWFPVLINAWQIPRNIFRVHDVECMRNETKYNF